MRKASLLFIFEPNPGLEGSMSPLRSGPRRPRSTGPRAPSRAYIWGSILRLRGSMSPLRFAL